MGLLSLVTVIIIMLCNYNYYIIVLHLCSHMTKRVVRQLSSVKLKCEYMQAALEHITTLFKPGAPAVGHPRTWFLKIVSVRISICVCVFVCVCAKAINN